MSAPAVANEVLTDYARTVNDLESSRRVGWAKMYAALAAGEKAERELAIAREDIVLLSRFAGFTYGALQALGLRDIYHCYLKGDLDQLQSYLPHTAINSGRNVGEGWRKAWINRLADKTAMYEARARAQEANERQMAAARHLVREELAAEYGFATVDELEQYLSQHRRAS